MPQRKGGHLVFDDRCEIEEMLKDGKSFREIARKLGVSPTTVSSYDFCKEFDFYTCERRERAPFVCTQCSKRGFCTYEKARYVASKAQSAHDERLSLAHVGISCKPYELRMMVDHVKKRLS